MKSINLMLAMLLTMMLHSVNTHVIANADTSFNPIILDVADGIEIVESYNLDNDNNDPPLSLSNTIAFFSASVKVKILQSSLACNLDYGTRAIRAPPTQV